MIPIFIVFALILTVTPVWGFHEAFHIPQIYAPQIPNSYPAPSDPFGESMRQRTPIWRPQREYGVSGIPQSPPRVVCYREDYSGQVVCVEQ